MDLIKVATKIHHFEDMKDFVEAFDIRETDLILTHQFLYDGYMANLKIKANFIMQEKYGSGEPSDTMMNAILAQARSLTFDRIIAIGGGTVLDIAKLLVLKDITDVVDAFEKRVPLIKDKALVALPTTCGTGSEVTNITIAEIKSKQTKMGLAVDELLPDHAVLIPSLLEGLPYKYYVYSSIDALIHAVESHVSPKANAYTKLFSEKAIEIIIDIYLNIVDKGEAYRFQRLDDMAIASNYAGIAFGNAGVGAVHALSYPLGGRYHVAHGEANYQFFTEVFKLYTQKKPEGSIQTLNAKIAGQLGVACNDVYEALETLLGQLLKKKPLETYGMKVEEIESFTDSVIQGQGRLLANNYVALSRQEILGIYKNLYA